MLPPDPDSAAVADIQQAMAEAAMPEKLSAHQPNRPVRSDLGTATLVVPTAAHTEAADFQMIGAADSQYQPEWCRRRNRMLSRLRCTPYDTADSISSAVIRQNTILSFVTRVRGD
jgi:hypothetical protein